MSNILYRGLPCAQYYSENTPEEYVSVYETLGAKIDELEKKLEDAQDEIARLISRALTAEAKLNIKSSHKFDPFDNVPERCKFCGNSESSHTELAGTQEGER